MKATDFHCCGNQANAEAPLPPQHPTRVTTSLERDLESCRISIAYMTESRHSDAENLGFMRCPFTSTFLAKFEAVIQQGGRGESKRSWQSSAGPCSLPRLIPGQGLLWHQHRFHVFAEMLGTERSIKIKRPSLPQLRGAEPRHSRAAAALHAVPEDQVTRALQLANRINSFLIQSLISVFSKGNLSQT